MSSRRARSASIGLAAGAVGVWVFVLATGGIVRRPPRKLERPAFSSSASTSAQGATSTAAGDARRTSRTSAERERGAAAETAHAPDARAGDPRARLDELERELGELLVPLPAGRFAGLDEIACAWSRSGAPNAAATDGEPRADDEFALWRAAHALTGTHVHGSLRIAIVGAQVVREGDRIDGARIARIDPGSVEIDWTGTARQLELAAPRASASGSAPDAGGGPR